MKAAQIFPEQIQMTTSTEMLLKQARNNKHNHAMLFFL